MTWRTVSSSRRYFSFAATISPTTRYAIVSSVLRRSTQASYPDNANLETRERCGGYVFGILAGSMSLSTFTHPRTFL